VTFNSTLGLAFTHSFLEFSHGKMLSDDLHAPGIEIGRSSGTFPPNPDLVAIRATRCFVTDGQLPYPYGRETTRYEVTSLDETLAKAKSAGVRFLLGHTLPIIGGP
jgi:hypothetical protein